jgi:uncharacterized BrkB/YihY/UPF0761 family membrane protein
VTLIGDGQTPIPPRQNPLQKLISRITGHPIVRRVQGIVAIANEAGAPLLAAALAFNTMFAIIPGLLLLSGVLGWAIDDPVRRAQLLADLVARVPPLAEAIADSIEGVVRARGGLTIVGVIGLLWGASNFYAVLEEVMRRMFAGGVPRGIVEQRVRGFITVLGLVALVLGAVLLSGLWTLIGTTVGELGGLIVLSFIGPLAFVLLATVATFLVYRFVPVAAPSSRAALPPAIVAGIGIGLLTSLYSVLAPVLVGGLAGFGILAAIFGAFIWLNFCFQLLLWGAAWARYRRDGSRLEEGVGPA